MDSHAYLGDPQREKEIHHLLDQIAVPDESMSDLSSDIILGHSAYDHESQAFVRASHSPGRHHEDFFENSINSTIAHTSPLSNANPNLEDSKIDSSLSQPYTPQQVSRMMDWPKNHINHAEGLFPQVSAPSMSIEGDMWESSPRNTPQPTMIMKSHSSADKSNNYVKKSIQNLPVLDLPTHEDKPSREGITFSPNNAEAGWFFNFAQSSKRSSANQSLKFPKNSFSTELMQGSALLAHAANHHFPSEISLSQVRDNAPIFDEIHKLKNELTNLKIVFRSEQSMHEETKKELYRCSCALQDTETAKRDVEDKNEELEERIKLMMNKMKNPESFETIRGKNLDLARNEIKQLKNYLLEKDKKIEDLKYALLQKSSIECKNIRDKEIEDLTYEITKLKIVNTSQTKQIKELNERLDKEAKNKDIKTGEMKNIAESNENKLKKLISKFEEAQEEIENKDSEIDNLNKKIKDFKQLLDNANKENAQYAEDINNAKSTIEILQKQLSGTYYEKTTSADYDFQLNKIRSSYEKKLEDAKEEITQHKAKIASQDTKIKNLEVHIAKVVEKYEDSYGAETKETVNVLQEELEKVYFAKEQCEKLCDLLRKQNDELKNIEITYKAKIAEDKEQEKSLKKIIEDMKTSENTLKIKITEEKDQEITKIKNSMSLSLAKTQYEKDDLLQKLIEKDQEILELKEDLEKSYKVSEEKVKMDMEYFKERLEKEKTEEIKRLKKIYNNHGATQTSFDYSVYRDEIRVQLENEYNNKIKRMQGQIEEKIRQEIGNDMKSKYEHEFEIKIKNIQAKEKEVYDKAIDEVKAEYSMKVEALKKDYTNNVSQIEEEFMNKVKSIENDYSAALRKNKSQADFSVRIESLEYSLSQKTDENSALKIKMKELEANSSKKIEEVNLLQEKVKELKNQLKDNQKTLTNKLLISQNEVDLLVNKAIETVKKSEELKKSELLTSFEYEKNNWTGQKEKLILELKIKDDQIKEINDKMSSLNKEYEKELEESERKYSEELEDYKFAYFKDLKDKEKTFAIKEKELERKHNEKIQDFIKEYNEKLQKEQEKYTEMINKKDLLSKTDNQRIKEEVAGFLAEKERELTESFNKKQKLLKAQFDNDIKAKELELEGLKDILEDEKRKIKEDYNEKLQNFKHESSKSKRELEREQKKLKDIAENAMESARKELEIIYLENLNKEKAEWERKEKSKIKILQSKYQKDLIDQEQGIKNEFELEKHQALQELADTYKQKIKQIQEEQKKYYEELRVTALEEKAHEIELQVRREMQEKYHRDISQLDAQHFQEKEKLREEFRLELAKRFDDVRNYSYIDNEISYLDLPFSGRKPKSSVGDSLDLRTQLEIYKQKLEQIELEKEHEKLSNFADLEKVRSSEYSKILQFVQEELNGYFTKVGAKNRNTFPELSGIIRGFFSKLDLEIDLQQERIKQASNLEQIRSSGEFNRKRLSQATLNVEFEDTYFVRFQERLYISLEKTIDDLVKLHKNLAERLKTCFPENFLCKTLKEEYFMLISMANRAITLGTDQDSQKNLSTEEREKLKRYENELKTLTAEFKTHMLKSKEWLENNNKAKEEWALEKSQLETKVQSLIKDLEKSKDSSPISPEMLSPEETSNLILGIFKRSSKDSIIIKLLLQNHEFLSVIQYLIEGDSPKSPTPKNYSVIQYETQNSLNSARSYIRPRSVDVEIQPGFNKVLKTTSKFTSPTSQNQNLYQEGFTFPYDN
ncbi:hypothetical protein SteCoe_4979 [Stentor coeruleus]|uniref:Uncharacterized protein n=1 Tax=Stentor coeruleus TaxID=5963 RepID=A0A1R2CTG7_9CILI|nr:hypothetical protein SteCoe_4979 [Stentor coeruleus]